MAIDHSQGWEAVADRFMKIRSEVGTAVVRSWAQECLLPSSSIVDVGCGSGVPIAKALTDDGFALFGIDASPTLIAAFRDNLPAKPVVCEPAQDSAFFGRTFEGAVSIGLIFLLSANNQRTVLGKVAGALDPGGRFLFSAPQQACEWSDTLTGRASLSLGADAYATHLDRFGLSVVSCRADEGGNNYYDAVKRA